MHGTPAMTGNTIVDAVQYAKVNETFLCGFSSVCRCTILSAAVFHMGAF